LSVALALALAVPDALSSVAVPLLPLSSLLVEELSSLPEEAEAEEVAPAVAEPVSVLVVVRVVVTCLSVPVLVPVAPGTMVVVSCDEAVGAVASTVMLAASVDEPEA
jgi:hypothetical protein